MKQDMISMRQFWCLLSLALLGLGLDLLPRLSGLGTAIWVLPLLALPLLLVGLRLGAGRRSAPRRDLGEALCLRWGRGKAALLLLPVLLWGVALLGLQAARISQRLSTAGASPLLFAGLLLALAYLLCRGKLPRLARSTSLFYLFIAIALAAVLLLCLPRLQPSYALLFAPQELRGLGEGLWTMAGHFALGLYALFFIGSVTRREGDGKSAALYASTLLLALAGVLFLIVACFGAALMSELPRPFFQMVASLGVEGGFQRLEALFSALFLLCDLALLCLLLRALGHIAAALLPKTQTERRAKGLFALGAFAVSTALVLHSEALRVAVDWLLPRMGLGAGVYLLFLFLLAGREKAGKLPAGKEIENVKSKFYKT